MLIHLARRILSFFISKRRFSASADLSNNLNRNNGRYITTTIYNTMKRSKAFLNINNNIIDKYKYL